MESKKINTSYEVEVSRDCFDLDKEAVTEVVFKTDSVRKAFARMAKIATEVCRDGFRPYSSALFAMVFEKGEGNGYENVEIRLKDAITGKYMAISYGYVGKYLSQEIFDKLLNDYIESIKNIAGKE